jgi:hypothetical protein
MSDPGERLDLLVRRALAALSPTPDAAAEGPFTGEADDGRVRAEVGPDGRLLTVSIDPNVSRPVSAIGPLVVEAVNAALDARGGAPDLTALTANLREVQEQSAVEMRRITESLSGALAETINRARAGDGAPQTGSGGPR